MLKQLRIILDIVLENVYSNILLVLTKVVFHAFFASKSLSWVINKHVGKLFLSLFCIRSKVKGRKWSYCRLKHQQSYKRLVIKTCQKVILYN